MAKQSRKTIAKIERDLGLSKVVLKHWVRQAEADRVAAFPGHGRLLPAAKALRCLQRE